MNLNCLQSGAAEPAIVLLHFFGGSSRTWQPLLQVLAHGPLAQNRIIAPDLRGFGASQDPQVLADATDTNFSVSQNADDVLQLLQTLEVHDFVLVGHSMGGKIAFEIASRAPAGLQALLLIAPSPPSPEPMSDADRAQMKSSWNNLPAIEKILRNIVAQPLNENDFQTARADHLKIARSAWHAWLDSGSREDLSDRANSIQIPVQVLAGACDSAMTPQLLQREIVARVPNATLQTVPNCGHLIPLEAPEFVARTLEEMLAR